MDELSLNWQQFFLRDIQSSVYNALFVTGAGDSENVIGLHWQREERVRERARENIYIQKLVNSSIIDSIVCFCLAYILIRVSCIRWIILRVWSTVWYCYTRLTVDWYMCVFTNLLLFVTTDDDDSGNNHAGANKNTFANTENMCECEEWV